MQTIACLGWGSLIWDPRTLPIRTAWFTDGPLAPVEFIRQSDDGRITLVIAPKAKQIRLLWAIMDVTDLDIAVDALRIREKISIKYISHVGKWTLNEKEPKFIEGLSEWASAKNIDAVVWTALPPKFNGEDNVVPSLEQTVHYLKSLSGVQRIKAERYIRNAPAQVVTEYRKHFEFELGWKPQ